MTFIVSCWHLGENRFAIMDRPFECIDEHNQTLIKNHNKIVNHDDLVIVNGDVCYKTEYLHLVDQFNGKKILIRGNHDRKITDADFRQYFEQIVPEGDGYELEVDGIKCFVTHYPTQGMKDRFNLVGHIHAAWKYQLNMLNTCVDVHNFYPTPLAKVPFYYKAIQEFYDDDVWCAYSDINTDFLGIRGKKGRYYDLRT